MVWIIVSYFPVSNIPVVLPTVRAERFWYFPALGSSVLLALLISLSYGSGHASASGGTSRVCLDPGHGGSDPGAVRGALVEKTLTLDIAQRLQALLAPGYEVKLTRADDATTLGNSARAAI